MDRRVKERLIGATILVSLIVLIVPEMLSGPKRPALPPRAASLPAPTRHVSVDLATSRATPAPQPADSAAATSAEPPGVVTPGVATPGAAAPSAPPMVTAPPTQGATAPPLETERSSPTSASETAKSAVDSAGSASLQAQSAWAVQLGSFASKANADKLVHQLKAGGSPVYVISSGAGPSLRYRVRLGPLPDRGAAERAVLKLKAAGHAATIINPAS